MSETPKTGFLAMRPNYSHAGYLMQYIPPKINLIGLQDGITVLNRTVPIIIKLMSPRSRSLKWVTMVQYITSDQLSMMLFYLEARDTGFLQT